MKNLKLFVFIILVSLLEAKQLIDSKVLDKRRETWDFELMDKNHERDIGLRTDLFRRKVAKAKKHRLVKAAMKDEEAHSKDDTILQQIHHHDPTPQDRSLEQLREALDITHYSNMQYKGEDLPSKTMAKLEEIAFNVIGAHHPLTPEPLKDELEEFIIPNKTEVTDTVQTMGDYEA